ncbi:hypothetical protein LZ30DRAFT_178626 [Colletotrichum cereale]|nr:hypothetical protein LZ30DRAFT_178626 [Colletotrichum cereale]
MVSVLRSDTSPLFLSFLLLFHLLFPVVLSATQIDPSCTRPVPSRAPPLSLPPTPGQSLPFISSPNPPPPRERGGKSLPRSTPQTMVVGHEARYHQVYSRRTHLFRTKIFQHPHHTHTHTHLFSFGNLVVAAALRNGDVPDPSGGPPWQGPRHIRPLGCHRAPGPDRHRPPSPACACGAEESCHLVYSPSHPRLPTSPATARPSPPRRMD